MLRLILISMSALAMLAGAKSVAQPQASNAMSSVVPDSAAVDHAPDISRVCITVRYGREKIILGRGGTGIQLELGGGACEPPGSGISDFSAGFATARGTEDIIERNVCPAFQTRINELWAARQHTRHAYGTIPSVRAGPFVITDWSDLFNLQSFEGRRAAARWINQTLAAVRPCWDTIRESYDPKHYVVDLLYDDLRKDVSAAVDAAVAQDRQKDYEQRHAPSPEAQAQKDENLNLYAAISKQKILEDNKYNHEFSDRAWIQVKNVTIDRVEREQNGPRMSAHLGVQVKNVGSVPITKLWTHLDLIPFIHISDHDWRQRRENVCNETMDFVPSQYPANFVIMPGSDSTINIDEKAILDFSSDDIAPGENELDFLVVVGCVKYDLVGSSRKGSSTFAYVVGKRHGKQFFRIGRGDGIMVAKDLKWISLNQNYEH